MDKYIDGIRNKEFVVVGNNSYSFKLRYLNSDGSYSKSRPEDEIRWIETKLKNRGKGNKRVVFANYWVADKILELIHKDGSITLYDFNDKSYKLETFSKASKGIGSSSVVARYTGINPLSY